MFSSDEIGPTITEYLGGFSFASNEALERCKKRISIQVTDELQMNRCRDETNEDETYILTGLTPLPRRGVIKPV
ncbi:hypothetical protein HNY73_010059 [Argiope bruennichi]|uniref:Uncharacterized protein n=1 Tax=Argiope bruennichi TaxID=94029 RepID=A0A8T0F0M0_ARGBR|nr:hypothetical protein HNY73_010059 [Argiope bruennichi]